MEKKRMELSAAGAGEKTLELPETSKTFPTRQSQSLMHRRQLKEERAAKNVKDKKKDLPH